MLPCIINAVMSARAWAPCMLLWMSWMVHAGPVSAMRWVGHDGVDSSSALAVRLLWLCWVVLAGPVSTMR